MDPRSSAAPNQPAPPGFVCASCGRTDLPEAGDWDPPICQECDAAINFDAERALEASRREDDGDGDDD